MDSNYYDEERMINEMNQALNYDPYAGFNDVPDYSNDKYGYLSKLDLEKQVKGLKRLEIQDFEGIPINSEIEGAEYIGWSNFSRDFISIYFVVQGEYYTYCVHNKTFLEDNFELLKRKNTTFLQFNGIKKKSSGSEYISLYMNFRMPLDKK